MFPFFLRKPTKKLGAKREQVVEALHEQIADLSTLLSELKGENHQQQTSPSAEEFGLSLDCIPLRAPTPLLAQKGGVGDENDVATPPYSGSRRSIRNSVSAFVRNSMAAVGP